MQQFKTIPYAHQIDALRVSASAPAFALFMEQRTGKTKVVIDTQAALYDAREVDALFIVAPNGVHRLWVEDEIPAHLLDDIERDVFLWRAGCLNSARGRDALVATTKSNKMAILAMNIDALRTDKGKAAAKWFLEKRRCLLAVDESTIIKTPGAKRTQVLLGRGKANGIAALAPYRRILTGTPVTQGPFDLFAQMKFLDENFWEDYGNFEGFKRYFGVWEKGYNRAAGREYNELVEYRNLPELKARVDTISYRITRDECFDLPPQVFQKHPFELTQEQRHLYDTLRDELLIEWGDGQETSAAIAIVKMIRLQQITSGFVPDDEGNMRHLEKNPRVDALLEVLEQEAQHQNIIWYRFQQDGHNIEAALKKLGRTYAKYDGTVSEEQRSVNKKMFTDGTVQDFIGNPAVGARGLELYMARNIIYFNNSYDLEHRLQSQDRTQSKLQKHKTGVIDLTATGTGDAAVADALRNKKSIADMLTGDRIRDWI